MFPPVVREMVMAGLRQAFSAFGAFLIGKGVMQGGDLELFVSGMAALAIGLGGALWTVARKRVKFLAALASPQEMTEHQLEAVMQDPTKEMPPLNKPKDKQPYIKTVVAP